MKNHIAFRRCFFAFLLGIAVTVCAGSAAPAEEVSEAQQVGSITAVSCTGTVIQDNHLSWHQSGVSLHGPPLVFGGIPWTWFDAEWNPVDGWTADPLVADLLGIPIPRGETRYIAGYSAGTMADQGTTTLARVVAADTGTMAGNGDNIDATTHLAFISNSGQGRVISREDLLIDATGAHTTVAGTSICPFMGTDGGFAAPFCNIVQMGSEIDVSQASVSTSAGGRFVSDTDRSPVTMDYTISAGGPSPDRTSYAAGSMRAFMNARLQEGRMENITPYNPDAIDQPAGFSPGKASDLAYSESTFSTGEIDAFFKDMHYQSGRNVL
jgi:hypothetical protein